MLITCGAAGGLAGWPPAAPVQASSARAAWPWPPSAGAALIPASGEVPAPWPEAARAPESGTRVSVTRFGPARVPEAALSCGDTVATATGPADAASRAVAGLLNVMAATA